VGLPLFLFQAPPKRLEFRGYEFCFGARFFSGLGFRFTAINSISVISLAFLFFAGVLHALDLFWRHKKAKSQESLDVPEGSV
jgi:hypothetical protein